MSKRSALVTSLDRWFSKYIRLKYSRDGYVDCYTCGRTKHWKEMQAGHFMVRGKYSTRWDEDNVRPQCGGCNMRSGEQYKFGQRLNTEKPHLAEEMRYKSNQIRKFSNGELQAMIDFYRERVQRILGE